MDELTALLGTIHKNIGLLVDTCTMLSKKIDALDKRISALEATHPDSVAPPIPFDPDIAEELENLCTCPPDGQPCPSCVRKAQQAHTDDAPLLY